MRLWLEIRLHAVVEYFVSSSIIVVVVDHSAEVITPSRCGKCDAIEGGRAATDLHRFDQSAGGCENTGIDHFIRPAAIRRAVSSEEFCTASGGRPWRSIQFFLREVMDLWSVGFGSFAAYWKR